METINALDMYANSDYNELGDILFSKTKAGHNETFLIKSNNVIDFTINNSMFLLKVKYMYSLTDIMESIKEVCILDVNIQRFNNFYKRFNISATLEYSGLLFNSEYAELCFSVKDIKYEEL
jgi:hypothetical protein